MRKFEVYKNGRLLRTYSTRADESTSRFAYHPQDLKNLADLHELSKSVDIKRYD